MDAKSIVDAVEKMRHAQREYFRTRSQDWLRESKALERSVDKMIADFRNPQGDLFAL